MGKFMKTPLTYVIIIVLLIALIYQCDRNAENKSRMAVNTEALHDSLKYYHNKLGSQTATIKTMQLDKHQLHDLILKKDNELMQLAKQFNAVKYVTKFKTETEVPSINVPFDPPAVFAADSTLRFTRSGSVFKDWFSFNYKVSNDSLWLSAFKTNTETTVITGVKQKWFLGEQTITTDITNSNPYVKVTAINAAEVTVPTPWYRKWYLWLTAGLVGGILIK
jgi:hypothetical protein